MSSEKRTEHEALCLSEGRIIIHDQALWAEFMVDALDKLKKNAKTNQGRTEIDVFDTPQGFDRRFGNDLSLAPKVVSGKITREDMFLLKGSSIVAQYVNYYWREEGTSAPIIFTCYGLDKNLHKIEEARDD